MKMLIAAAVLAAATPALAEVPLGAPAGARVRARFHGVDGSRTALTGRLLATDLDSVTIQPAEGDPVVVPLGRIDRFDRSWGRRGAGEGALRGAGVGLAFGALSGAVVGAAAPQHENDFFTPGDSALIGGVVFGVSGAVLGAIVGAVAPGEHWEPSEPRLVRVTVSPTRGGVAASVRLSF